MRRLQSIAAAVISSVVVALVLFGCRDLEKTTAPRRFSPAPVVTGAEATMGQWTAPFAWPIVALHLQLLPTGKVLSWGHAGEPYVWDPATGVFTQRPNPATEMFCAGHSFLPDGRLLVAGGHITDSHGLPDANIFDPVTETWTRVNDMAYGRWYPTNTTLPDGEVLTMAGTDQNAVDVATPEVWQAGRGWRELTGARLTFNYYPRMFVAPNGKVFYAGQDNPSRYLDFTGTGSWTTVGNRKVANRSYGSAVMYEPGKVLYVGGGQNGPTNTAEVIDLNEPAPAWRFTGSMAFARHQLNATILPDGTVLATGGTSGPGKANVAAAVHAAELWNPATEQWTTLASNQIVRVYHSTSILLPDARVLNSGTGDGGGTPQQLNAEIFSPPYLFNADGSLATRPTITSAPSAIGYGQSFTVQTPDAASITKVTLIRLGAATHAFDQNQRLNKLNFSGNAGALTVTAPANPNLAPPGHYMLFILNGNGVPSVAKILKIDCAGGCGGSPPPTNQPPSATITSPAANVTIQPGQTVNFMGTGSDQDGTIASYSWSFPGGTPSSSNAQNPGTVTYASAGTYTATFNVTDDQGASDPTPATRTITVQSSPPPAGTITVADFSFTPQALTLGAAGNTALWNFQGPSVHSVKDKSGMGLFFSGNQAAGSQFSFQFVAAGEYPYNCTIHTSMTGKVRVPIAAAPTTGRTTTTFTVTWASASAPAGYVFDVQIKRPGTTAFANWQQGVTTLSATFVPDAGVGTYVFRARLRNTANNKASGYSPQRSIKVT